MTPIHALDDVFVVSEGPTGPSGADLQALEAQLGGPLPAAYRDIISAFGAGVFCNGIRFYSPSDVIEHLPSRRNSLSYDHWDNLPESLVNRDRSDMVCFADSVNADMLCFAPDIHNSVFVFPRFSSQVHEIPDSALELLNWIMGADVIMERTDFAWYDNLKDIAEIVFEGEAPFTSLEETRDFMSGFLPVDGGATVSEDLLICFSHRLGLTLQYNLDPPEITVQCDKRCVAEAMPLVSGLISSGLQVVSSTGVPLELMPSDENRTP